MSQYQPPYQPFPPDEPPQWGQQPSQPFPPQQSNTQWGQPPQYQPQWQEQPGYPQQPPYQQPFQPPKKKSRKGLWIALAIVAAVVVFGCVGVVALVSAGGHAVQNAANQASTEIATAATGLPTQPTSAQQTSQQNAAGNPVVASDTWTVTLNSAATSTGTDFITPKSGNIFLEVDVTLKNTSSSSQTASSLLMFSLTDGTGQKYDESLGVQTTPDGAVAAGGLLRGTVTFEVPKSVHTFTLQFQPDITSSTIVQWTVKD